MLRLEIKRERERVEYNHHVHCKPGQTNFRNQLSDRGDSPSLALAPFLNEEHSDRN